MTAPDRRLAALLAPLRERPGEAAVLCDVGCAHAGNHGMELHLPGARPYLADGVAEHVPTIGGFAATWPPERLATGDLQMEEKGATLSIHARGARDPKAADLLRDSGALAALHVGDDRTDADAWLARRELREEGALRHAAGLALASAEVPARVREAADAEVDGPAGALAAPRLLAH